MGILPPFLGPGWDLPPKHLSSRTFCSISAWVSRSPVGSPRYLMDSSLGYSAVPLPPITMYACPNEDFISLMFTAGSLESSKNTGSHCELSKSMSNSIGPAGVSIHGMCALTDGNTSLAQGGSFVSATVVISSTLKVQIT